MFSAQLDEAFELVSEHALQHGPWRSIDALTASTTSSDRVGIFCIKPSITCKVSIKCSFFRKESWVAMVVDSLRTDAHVEGIACRATPASCQHRLEYLPCSRLLTPGETLEDALLNFDTIGLRGLSTSSALAPIGDGLSFQIVADAAASPPVMFCKGPSAIIWFMRFCVVTRKGGLLQTELLPLVVKDDI